jgi:hypothetical protein
VSRDNLPFCLAQRTFAALLALSFRCSAVSFLARALPPCFPNFAKYFVNSFRFTGKEYHTCVRATHFILDMRRGYAYNPDCLGNQIG